MERATDHSEGIKSMKDDLISRQQAIDAICESANDLQDVLIPVYYRKLIENLPSAQLEPPIIKCKDCKWWRKQKDSEQGRCGLLGFYPTGEWYCANGARERRTDEIRTP